MTFWYGSGSSIRPRNLLFSSLTFKTPTKNYRIFFQSFSAHYFLKVYLHHFSKKKSHKEVTKQQESRFFLLLLLEDRRIRIREAKKHTDPTDPDPQHCFRVLYLYCINQMRHPPPPSKRRSCKLMRKSGLILQPIPFVNDVL